MGKVIIYVDWDTNYGAAPKNENVACVATGKTLAEVKNNIAEALKLHIAWMREDGDNIPEEFNGEYELEYELSGRALIHYAESLVSRSALSKASGINERQLGHYYTGVSTPRPKQIERMRKGIKEIVNQLSLLAL